MKRFTVSGDKCTWRVSNVRFNQDGDDWVAGKYSLVKKTSDSSNSCNGDPGKEKIQYLDEFLSMMGLDQNEDSFVELVLMLDKKEIQESITIISFLSLPMLSLLSFK